MSMLDGREKKWFLIRHGPDPTRKHASGVIMRLSFTVRRAIIC